MTTRDNTRPAGGFRALNAKLLEPAAMLLMVLGIIALCQPWSEVAHRYGLTVTLVGLVGFLVFSHVPPPEKE